MSVKAPDALLRAQRLANFLDNGVRLPVVRLRVGMDAIVGLIPGIGDMLMFVASLLMLKYARQLGLPASLQAHMLKNSLIDLVLGLIPVVGDLADIFYRANQKNVRLMEAWWLAQHYAAIKRQGQQAVEAWQQQLPDQ